MFTLMACSACTDPPQVKFSELVSTGDLKVVQLAIKAGADVNAKNNDGLSPLMHAGWRNSNPLVIAELIKAGVCLSAAYKNLGITVLMLVAEANEDLLVLEGLIQAGHTIHAKDNKGKSVLNYAREGKCTQNVAVLIKAGAK